MLAGCGHAETPQEAAYREYAAATDRLDMAIKAHDQPRMCREKTSQADAMLRAGNQSAYERDAAFARIYCTY